MPRYLVVAKADPPARPDRKAVCSGNNSRRRIAARQHKVLQLGMRSVLAVLVLSTTAIASTKPSTAPALTTVATVVQRSDDGGRKLRHLDPGRARRSTHNHADARRSMIRRLSERLSVDTEHAAQCRGGHAAGYGPLPLPGRGTTTREQDYLSEIVVKRCNGGRSRRQGAEGCGGE